MKHRVPGVLTLVVIALGMHGVVAFSAGTWVNDTANLANMPSECGNLTMLSPVPNSTAIIAGVALQGLWTTSGGTWTHLGSGAGSDTITNRPTWIAYDPANAGTFWESGIYNGGGVYKTTDNGMTFHQLGSIGHIDYVSVDFSDPNRQTLLAGGHEQPRTVWRSTNGGLDWTNIGLNLPQGTGFSSDPLIIDSQTYLVNTPSSWGGGSPGIYRTTNGGASWQQVSTVGPFGPPLVAADATIYWSAGNSLVKSINAGVSWTQVGSNLVPEVRPIELPDTRLAAIGTGSNLLTSADSGSTWTSVSGSSLPFTAVGPGVGVIYSANRAAFFSWHNECVGAVLPDAVLRFDFPLSGQTQPGAPLNLRILP